MACFPLSFTYALYHNRLLGLDIIGNVGDREDRIVGETPVYRLNCTTFEIEPAIATGDRPSWISSHQAVLGRDRTILVDGGKVWQIDGDKLTSIDNREEYILDLDRCHWQRRLKQERNPDWQELIYLLRRASDRSTDEDDRSIEFAPGLTDAEIDTLECNLDFRFPADLRAFLQTALPCGSGFPDWRNSDLASLQEWLESPLKDLLDDVEHQDFWMDEWGTRPDRLDDALELVTQLVRAAPRLIPVNNHRMMPAEPHSPGNPVFSLIGSDIIHYGFDLDDYLRAEFHLPDRQPWPTQVRSIRFWDIDRFYTARKACSNRKFENK